MMKLLSIVLVILSFQYSSKAIVELDDTGQCTLENRGACNEPTDEVEASAKYKKDYNEIFQKIEEALRSYKPCAKEVGDPGCVCHADVIARDLESYQTGVSKKMIEDSAKYGTRYKILNHRLYRDAECMFPTRCSGIEYFVRQLLPDLPDMDLVMNTRDWPQLRTNFGAKGPVFSFSKTREYRDVMYPAWSFWAGGPAISLHPTGIGRWDLFRESISKEAAQTPWSEKNTLAFFRGSRTSDERDSLVLLSRRSPNLVDAQYTKNQAWKSPKDTLNAEPAKEVSFEHHCHYKYLFNFRGVAASFRLKHLFLCKSLVFHVGEEWNEFFYFALKPWVHYVPLKSYPSEQDIEQMLLFFREHDDLAKEIANRGYEFIWQHLRMEDVECYWKNLLLQYQKFLLYNVTEDATLIEVKARYK